MATISKFDLTVIESIAKLLGDTSNGFTGSEITSLLNASKIEDIAPGGTKWKRLNSALVNKQDLDKCANNILAFIEHAMKPSRYINNHEWFNNTRFELDKVLSFAGYSLQENGKISTTTKSYTTVPSSTIENATTESTTTEVLATTTAATTDQETGTTAPSSQSSNLSQSTGISLNIGSTRDYPLADVTASNGNAVLVGLIVVFIAGLIAVVYFIRKKRRSIQSDMAQRKHRFTRMEVTGLQ